MNCRHCNERLRHTFLDLGAAPPSNAYLTAGALAQQEVYFPLKIFVCERCWLVQTADHAAASDLFSADYAYFSSVSRSWVDHAARYADMIVRTLGVRNDSLVVEIASNDGYLLRNFVERGLPCLGIEPTESTAAAAEAIGVPVLREFFGTAVAERLVADGKQADLLIANNVYAHVPDINDFTKGLKVALKEGGTITLEFPHLMQLLAHNQFDTVYHEHFSYFSLYAVEHIFSFFGLRVFDVEELPTHGGSLRVYGCHAHDHRPTDHAVSQLVEREASSGLRELSTYLSFQPRADRIKDDLLKFLLESKRAGKIVAGYGAAAKGNTLLNYGGVKPDLVSFVCDAAPSKQGKFLPGSRIPILPPEALREKRPDVVLVLPWNIADEVMQEHAYIREWGAVFAVAVPRLTIWENPLVREPHATFQTFA